MWSVPALYMASQAEGWVEVALHQHPAGLSACLMQSARSILSSSWI